MMYTLTDLQNMTAADRAKIAARYGILTPSGKPSTSAARIHAEQPAAAPETAAPEIDTPETAAAEIDTPETAAPTAHMEVIRIYLTVNGATAADAENIRRAAETAAAPILHPDTRARMDRRILIPEGLTAAQLTGFMNLLDYQQRSAIVDRCRDLINGLTSHSNPAAIVTPEDMENGETPELVGGTFRYEYEGESYETAPDALMMAGFMPTAATYTHNGQTYPTAAAALTAAGFTLEDGQWEDMNQDAYTGEVHALTAAHRTGVVTVSPLTPTEWIDEDGETYPDETAALDAAQTWGNVERTPADDQQYPPMWGTVWELRYMNGHTPQEIADFTGFTVYQWEGTYIIGVNGGGYDFYEAHWVPLFYMLGSLSN
ncbi:hypothetical protein IHN63_00020 [Deinococcus sp. 6YEL10]|uniref:hypothetical protein n=1 Tax=Deinococcus sp. 6YEL10 TaxID=2745870 RepID=UPI001E4C23E8|nr:hypothetical protein [Deinococcus sp. 6YEL10]MCD0159683.1 hypothetical protein [Deinococcus sp. 6YEL10]